MKHKIMTTLIATAVGAGIAAAVTGFSGNAEASGTVTIFDAIVNSETHVYQGQLPPKYLHYQKAVAGGKYDVSVTLQSYREAGDGQYIGIYAGELHRLGERPGE